MENISQTDKPVQTIRLDDSRLAQILARLDESSSSVRENKRQASRYAYRLKALVVHMQQPGAAAAVPYLVPTRNISEAGMSFLHGGYVHKGTRCLAQLVAHCGEWRNIVATVVRCRYLEANVHEVAIRFDHNIDPASFCTAAIRPRVLLVEDDPAVSRLALFHLGQLNADVEHAADGKRAVDLALGRPYDMILMDMELPVLNGLAATVVLRRKGYIGRIVAFTALTRPEDREKFLQAGCDDILLKPFSRQDLCALLQNAANEPIVSCYANDPAMGELIDAFVGELAEKSGKLEDAMKRGDLALLGHLARDMKAQGGGYGFEPVSNAAAKLEEALMQRSGLTDIHRRATRLLYVCKLVRGPNRSVMRVPALPVRPRTDAPSSVRSAGAARPEARRATAGPAEARPASSSRTSSS